MNSSFRRICGENTRVAPVRDGLGILRFSQFFCTAVIAAILPLWPQLECGQSHIKNRTFNAGKPPKKAVFLRKVVRVTGFEPAASCSQSRRATSCATPGYSVFYPAGRILPNLSRILFSLVYSGFRHFLICFTYSLTLLSPLFPGVPEPYVVIYVVKNASRPVPVKIHRCRMGSVLCFRSSAL